MQAIAAHYATMHCVCVKQNGQNGIQCIRKRIKDDNIGFVVMVSGNCQVGPYLYRGSAPV